MTKIIGSLWEGRIKQGEKIILFKIYLLLHYSYNHTKIKFFLMCWTPPIALTKKVTEKWYNIS